MRNIRIKTLFFICLVAILPAKLYSQSFFNDGFIPNEGQFLSKNDLTIYGKFTIDSNSVFLTERGLEGDESFLPTGLSVSKANIIYDDPYNYDLNFYLPHCPQGVKNVKVYSTLTVVDALQGINWEIKFSEKEGWLQRFVSKDGKDDNKVLKTNKGDVLCGKVYRLSTPIQNQAIMTLESHPVIDATATTAAATTTAATTTATTHPATAAATTTQPTTQAQPTTPKLYPLDQEWGTYWSGGQLYTSGMASTDDYRNFKNLDRNYFSLSSSCTDTAGNLYIAGKGKIIDFRLPQTGSIDSSFFAPSDTSKIKPDAFFAKFDREGRLKWATYYGSSMHDHATVIGVNKNNEVYVAGSISMYPTPLKDEINIWYVYSFPVWNNDFPVYKPNSPSPSAQQKGSMFILKFDETGNRIWANLYSNNQDNTNTLKVITTPMFLSVSSQNEVFIAGDYAAHNYGYVSGSLVSGRGMHFPTFGELGDFLWTGDSLKTITGTTPSDRGHDGSTDPFFIKLNTNDSVVWSTYLPLKNRIKGFELDSKDNIYFYGQTAASNYPKLIKREGAYFANKTTNPSNYSKVSYPVIGRINAKGKMDWCSHIGDDKCLNDYSLPGAMDINRYDHVIVTGTTSSDDFPMLNREGAYFKTSADEEVKTSENMFITEFDTTGQMLWSTLVPSENNNMGLEICSDHSGGVFVIMAKTVKSPSSIEEEITSPILQDQIQVVLSHFNKYGALNYMKELPIISSPLCWYNNYNYRVSRTLSISEYERRNLSRIHVLPEFKLSVSEYGKLFMTGNALSVGNELLVQSEVDSYMQSSPVQENNPLTGFIMRYDLCDTSKLEDLKMPIRDTVVCSDSPLSIDLNLRTDNYVHHEFIWNRGLENEAIGDNYNISEKGKYYVEANSVFPRCKSVIGDTVEVAWMAKPHFEHSGDTIEFCISDSVSYIYATLGMLAYLWSDSTTDTVYKVVYKGEEYETVWCEQTSLCDTKRDTVYVRFLPPYAILGIDTMLCHRDTLVLDARLANKDLPVEMEYKWWFNGQEVSGSGESGGYYTVRPYDSGFVAVSVEWPNSYCKIARDTINVSYYRYEDVDFKVDDLWVCDQEEGQLKIEIDSLKSSPDEKFYWFSPNGEFITNEKEIEVRDTGLYVAMGKNYCSTLIDTVRFTYYPLEWTNLNFPVDTIICEGETLTLDAKVKIHPTTYLWEDSTINSLRVFPSAGNYGITLTDTAGCEQSYEINIVSESCEPVLEVVNVFTPNGDGVNDLFSIKTAQRVYNFEIRLFNRWGGQVYYYKGEAEDFTWNGTFNRSSTEVPDGTYFYVISYKDFKNRNKSKGGSVTVLR